MVHVMSDPIRMTERDALRLGLLNYRINERVQQFNKLQAEQAVDQAEARELIERYGLMGHRFTIKSDEVVEGTVAVLDAATGAPITPQPMAPSPKPKSRRGSR